MLKNMFMVSQCRIARKILVAGEDDGRTDGRDEADSRFSQLLCGIPNECDVSKTEFPYEILQTS